MNTFSKLAVPASLGLLLAGCGGGTSVPLAGSSLSQSAISHVESQAASSVHVMPVFHPGEAPPPAQGLLLYHNGPVQHATKIYVVFWGFTKKGDPDKERAYLESFLKNVGGSSWLNTVTQYHDNNGNIGNAANQLAKVWVDKGNAIPTSPSDADIQAEAVRLAAKFGYDNDASYVVATSHGHNSPGFGTSFCAYHGHIHNSNGSVAYTNLPYIPDAGSSCGMGSVNNPGTLDGVSIVEGHELAETQTDPIPTSGWATSSGSEIGDLCAWQNLQNTQFSSGTFPTQPLYSDASASCVQSYQ
jgi:serine protease